MRTGAHSAPPPYNSTLIMGGSPHASNSPSNTTAGKTSSNDTTVAQALEIARESADGASDPTISNILETALAQIWGKVEAHPDSYVMTRDEFAVFNFFQQRFVGNKVAVAARKRFWDNTSA